MSMHEASSEDTGGLSGQVDPDAFNTADIFDASPERVRMIDAPLKHFGGRRRFTGTCVTLAAHGDAQSIADTVMLPGDGKVLVIDGRDLPDLACLGEIMVKRLLVAGWSGAIVLGAIRDSEPIGQLPIGIMALRTTAKRPFVEGIGERDVPIEIERVVIRSGATIFADDDAVLIVQPEDQ